ncbi:hypothetical protein CDD83_7621 [Cordyceps sp. RAO-2017]|nr:hypothetical protein CDD83_7621 [Cordyceps sp. RAO-2017]
MRATAWLLLARRHGSTTPHPPLLFLRPSPLALRPPGGATACGGGRSIHHRASLAAVAGSAHALPSHLGLSLLLPVHSSTDGTALDPADKVEWTGVEHEAHAAGQPSECASEPASEPLDSLARIRATPGTKQARPSFDAFQSLPRPASAAAAAAAAAASRNTASAVCNAIVTGDKERPRPIPLPASTAPRWNGLLLPNGDACSVRVSPVPGDYCE